MTFPPGNYHTLDSSADSTWQALLFVCSVCSVCSEQNISSVLNLRDREPVTCPKCGTLWEALLGTYHLLTATFTNCIFQNGLEQTFGSMLPLLVKQPED